MRVKALMFIDEYKEPTKRKSSVQCHFLAEDISVNTKHDSRLGIFDVVTRLFLYHSLFLQQGRNMLTIIKIIFLVSRYKYKHKKDAHLLLS